MEGDESDDSASVATCVEDLVPSEEADGVISPPDATNGRVLESLRDESREVLNLRIEMLNETDDKAARTVRTAVIVLSIIFSAAGIADPSDLQNLPDPVVWFSIAGIGCLFITVVAGVLNYSDSETKLGPDRDFRLEPRREAYSEREWNVLLLSGYDEWISTMESTYERNKLQLWWVQVLLILSLFLLMVALGLLVVLT
jgi:hypothetical protein